jgi:hypothetical protein
MYFHVHIAQWDFPLFFIFPLLHDMREVSFLGAPKEVNSEKKKDLQPWTEAGIYVFEDLVISSHPDAPTH